MRYHKPQIVFEDLLKGFVLEYSDDKHSVTLFGKKIGTLQYGRLDLGNGIVIKDTLNEMCNYHRGI
jgi:hypothetical protein